MSNPVLVKCNKSEWTIAVLNSRSGELNLKRINQVSTSIAYYTHVDSGEAAPTIAPGKPGDVAIPFLSTFLPWNTPLGIDIYVWAMEDNIEIIVHRAN